LGTTIHTTKSIAVPLVATVAIQAQVSMAALTMPVLTPVAAVDLGIAPTYIGIYVALIYIGGMATGLLTGDLVQHYGAIRASQLCLGLCALGLAMTSSASLPMLVISALVIGFGYGPVTPASSEILARITPSHLMSLVFSLKQTGVPLGGAIAGVIVPPIVLLAGWKFTALVVGGFCLMIAFLVQPTRSHLDIDLQPDRPITFRSLITPIKMAMTHPLIRVLTIGSFLYVVMQSCLVTYLVTYLTGDLGITLIAAGVVLSVAQTAGIIGRIVWGAIADRYIKPSLLLGLLGISMSLWGFATALFSPAWPYSAILAVSALFGATAIGWNGVYLAEVARLAPEGKAGMVTGGTLFFTFSGVVIGPPIFGAIANITASYSASYLAFSAATLLYGVFLTFEQKKF
jgi:MFS family permease